VLSIWAACWCAEPVHWQWKAAVVPCGGLSLRATDAAGLKVRYDVPPWVPLLDAHRRMHRDPQATRRICCWGHVRKLHGMPARLKADLGAGDLGVCASVYGGRALSCDCRGADPQCCCAVMLQRYKRSHGKRLGYKRLNKSGWDMSAKDTSG
jgi:hypothetical protein